MNAENQHIGLSTIFICTQIQIHVMLNANYHKMFSKYVTSVYRKSQICEVIKQNESEVGSDKLLASEVSFRFNIRKCQF